MDGTDGHNINIKSVPVSDRSSLEPVFPSVTPCSSTLAATDLSFSLACHLLDRQIETSKDFENEGGFTERTYRVRTEKGAEDE